MKPLLFTVLAALSYFPTCVMSAPIQAYWSPTDVRQMIANAERSEVVQPVAQGLGFPLLLVFAADGSLAWHGEPSDLPAMTLESAEGTELQGELAMMVRQMDEITRQADLSKMPLPSQQISAGQPTAVLVVLSTHQGLCPPCDRSLASFEQLPGEWNLIVAALSL